MTLRRRRLARAGASLAMAAFVLLWPAAAPADHDRIPDPAPRSTSARLTAGLRLDRGTVTVSGLSSGGFFAHQFHVAHSALITGAGILAGGPYGCVETITNPHWPHPPLDRLSAALVACSHYSGELFWGLRPDPPRARDSLALVADAWRRGDIDDPANLADDRAWLFRGESDEIVPEAVEATLQGVLRGAQGQRPAAARRAAEPGASGQPRHAGRQVPRREPLPEAGLLGASPALRHRVRVRRRGIAAAPSPSHGLQRGAGGPARRGNPRPVRPNRVLRPPRLGGEPGRRRIRLRPDRMPGRRLPPARRVPRVPAERRCPQRGPGER